MKEFPTSVERTRNSYSPPINCVKSSWVHRFVTGQRVIPIDLTRPHTTGFVTIPKDSVVPFTFLTVSGLYPFIR